MRIAILGATSQIAKDLVLSFGSKSYHELVLYARRPQAVSQWLIRSGIARQYAVADYGAFSSHEHFDAIFNFVGVGNPAQAAAMGASIFDVTLKYDEMAINYVCQHPDCRYIFLSSGAAYCSAFEEPVDANSKAVISINNLQPQDWYAIAKLHAECRHRSLLHLPIVDIRVFNYFSHTQDISARFLICDILRAIMSRSVLRTSSEYIVRDYLHPEDFYQLIDAILIAPAVNASVDCYSRKPIDKPALLLAMQERFELQYEIVQSVEIVNATGGKSHYYSLNRAASVFGYWPSLTSLDGIFKESQIVLQKNRRDYLRG